MHAKIINVERLYLPVSPSCIFAYDHVEERIWELVSFMSSLSLYTEHINEGGENVDRLLITANEKPRRIVGIFKTTRICRQYVAKWLIQHQTLANSIEVVLK